MKRRNFLKSLGAVGLMPALPMPAFSKVLPAASPVVSAHTYQWASMIVRAHNSCTTAMLQRLLRLEPAMAEAVKSELLKNGIISAQANSFGIHTATKPLYEGAFVKPHNAIASSSADRLGEAVEQVQIAQNDDELSDDAVQTDPSALVFHEADVKMVESPDVLAILEQQPAVSSFDSMM